jgi:hypothetical protein
VSERDGIHPLTQVILSIFWFLQLSFQGSETLLAMLQKAYALHMSHAFALVVVDAIGEVHLVREKDGLRRSQGYYGCLRAQERGLNASGVAEHCGVRTVCESRSNTFIAKGTDIILVM